MSVEAFGERIGHRFRDTGLLHCALTHRSHSTTHNERLEFLGDGVLNCAIAAELYRRFPQSTEGELSRLRAHLVSQPTLSATAQRLGVGDVLFLGEGELRSGGGQRPSILADALEAVVGAVFLDGGYEAASGVVRNILAEPLAQVDPGTTGKDPKTSLQEYLQARRISLPQYTVVATHGMAHQQQFQVECVISELDIRTLGEGASRRGAEQIAARRAYERLTRE